MKNFTSRIPLGNGKYAYDQEESFRNSAEDEVRRVKRFWSAPKHFYHVQPGGHVAAAKTHLPGQFFAKLDLSRFFEQVTKNRIIKRLVAIGYSMSDANDFAVVSTVRIRGRFALPYGFVQSPILASMDLDQSALGGELKNLKSEGLNTSVYVDDIIISSNSIDDVINGWERLLSAAEKSNYLVNEAKSAAPSETITAFNIDISHSHMAVSAPRLRQFEENIAHWGDSPESVATFAYVLSVNTDQALKLFAAFPKKLASAAGLVAKTLAKP